MSLLRCLAIARKEVHHITRDRRILFLVIASPAILGFAFSYVFSYDVDQAGLALLDLDRTMLSRRYVNQITADGDLWIDTAASNWAEVQQLLLRGEVDAALVVPRGFSAKLQQGQVAHVQTVLDGLETLKARITSTYLAARTNAFAEGLRGMGAEQTLMPVQARSRAWYNVTLSSLTSMVPGLLAVVLQMPSLAVALAFSRERETGSFESLITTPIRGPEYLLGKLVAYLGAGVLSALLAVAVAVWWFLVPFRGSLGLFLLLCAVFYLASMASGSLVGTLVPSQQTAMMIMLLTVFIPSFFLSGLLLPVDQSSRIAQLSASMLPSTHFIRISRSLFLKGSGLKALWPSVRSLTTMGLGLIALNVVVFRKRTG